MSLDRAITGRKSPAGGIRKRSENESSGGGLKQGSSNASMRTKVEPMKRSPRQLQALSLPASKSNSRGIVHFPYPNSSPIRCLGDVLE